MAVPSDFLPGSMRVTEPPFPVGGGVSGGVGGTTPSVNTSGGRDPGILARGVQNIIDGLPSFLTGGSSGGGGGNPFARIMEEPFRIMQMAFDSTPSGQPQSGDPILDLLNMLTTDSGGGGGGGFGHPDPMLGRDRFNWEQETWQQEFQHLLDQFAADEEQRELDNKYRDNVTRWNKAMDERDFALSMGDLDLARQAQASADHWQQQSLETQRAIAEASNMTSLQQTEMQTNASMQNAMMSARSGIEAAQIRAATDRQDSLNRLQVGLANAQNDSERNRVLAAWNEEQANIARMEDETRRMLGVQQNLLERFRGETERMGVAGQLAQQQNELIAEMARSPRDLFGLYFMQRGVTPDWDAIAAGNAPVGDPLLIQNALTAYTPEAELPDIQDITDTDAVGQVGTATAGMSDEIAQGGANPWLDGVLSQQMGETGQYNPDLSFLDFAPSQADYGLGQIQGGVEGVPEWESQMPAIDINPGGELQGVPIARVQPGMNLSTVGGEGTWGRNFDLPAFYDEARTKPIGADDRLEPGMQVWVEGPALAAGTNMRPGNLDNILASIRSQNAQAQQATPQQPAPRQALPQQAAPQQKQQPRNVQAKATVPQGFTTAPVGIVGDANAQNPRQGGAKPEMFFNPTRAPIGVTPTDQVDFGSPNNQARDLKQRVSQGQQPPMWQDINRQPQGRAPAVDQNRRIREGTQQEEIAAHQQRDMMRQRAEEALANMTRPIGTPNQGPSGLDSMLEQIRGMVQGLNDPNRIRTLEPGQSIGYAPPRLNPLDRMDFGTPNRVDAMPRDLGGRQPFFNKPGIARDRPWQPNLGGQQISRMSPDRIFDALDSGMPRFNRGTNREVPRYARGTDQVDFGSPMIEERKIPSIIRGLLGVAPTQEEMVPRYATGTSEGTGGMGSQVWQHSSGNQHIQNPDQLPQWLRTLNEQGAPLPPALVDAVTGQTGGQLNLGSAFQQRGGGMLPSFQALNQMSPGEREMLQGFIEGPVGMPFTDVVDFMARPTQNLQQAQRATGQVI